MNRKGFTPIIILLIGIGIFAVGFIGYYLYQHPYQSALNLAGTPGATTSSSSSQTQSSTATVIATTSSASQLSPLEAEQQGYGQLSQLSASELFDRIANCDVSEIFYANAGLIIYTKSDHKEWGIVSTIYIPSVQRAISSSSAKCGVVGHAIE